MLLQLQWTGRMETQHIHTHLHAHIHTYRHTHTHMHAHIYTHIHNWNSFTKQFLPCFTQSTLHLYLLPFCHILKCLLWPWNSFQNPAVSHQPCLEEPWQSHSHSLKKKPRPTHCLNRRLLRIHPPTRCTELGKVPPGFPGLEEGHEDASVGRDCQVHTPLGEKLEFILQGLFFKLFAYSFV